MVRNTIGNLRDWVRRAPDSGGAGGGGQQTGGADGGTGDGAGDPKPDPNAGNSGGTPPAVTFTPEQQAHIDRVIGERLSRAKEKWQGEAAEAKTKAEQDAEQKRLKDQAEWQKLAEQHETKVKELEPQVKILSDQVAAYKAAVEGMLAAKVKELGDRAKAAVEALPGEPDALARLNWLNANVELFAQAGEQRHIGTPPPKGRRPQAGGEGQDDKLPKRPLARL